MYMKKKAQPQVDFLDKYNFDIEKGCTSDCAFYCTMIGDDKRVSQLLSSIGLESNLRAFHRR